MICMWCKGTFEECGCGMGHCDHCDNGQVTNPPYGPQRYLEFDDIILEDTDGLIDFNLDNWVEVLCERVSKKIANEMILSEAEVKMFVDYWDERFRDETVGDVIQRIAMCVTDKHS